MKFSGRWLWLGAGVIIVVIAIIMFTQDGTNFSFSLPVESVVIGTPRREDEIGKANPKLLVKDEYTTTEPIAVRVANSAPVEEPLILMVRLINHQGTILEISPSTITVSEERPSYCCWTLPDPGEFTFQFFDAQGLVTALPVRITQAARGPDTTNRPKLDFSI